MSLSDFTVNPVTLVFLVMALVQFIKDFGLKGNAVRLVSLAVGVALALVFKARELYPQLVQYIDLGFFALAAGLGASGAYSLIDERLPKKG